MLALDATVGTTTANSYLTEDEADSYFEGHIDSSAWDNATNRVALLVHSTRLLEFYMDWYGDKVGTDEEQALDWPREEVPGVLDTVIPTRLKNATCELAAYIASKGSSVDLASANSISVGPIKIDLDSMGAGFLLPPQVSRMLNSLGSAKSLPKNGVSTVEVYR